MQAARLVLLGLAVLALIVACWLTGCGGGSQADVAVSSVDGGVGPTTTTAPGTSISSQPAKPKPTPPKPVDPVIVLHTSAGDIQLQLFREKAPQSVDNFLHNYAQRQFYDGTIFHHVEGSSMIIGGGYTNDLTAKETRSPIYNESQNGLKNVRGAVAMIRDPAKAHSATSQFFINVADNPALDCQGDPDRLNYSPSDDEQAESPEAALNREQAWGYCVFGEVTAGMEIVDRIAQAPTAADGDFARLPVQPITINSVERIR
ncbi:MAG: peptidylprolyl isomerase [Planctomycetaceae bacterium]|nr:peptidylprolyl isomerase [Planctomycetaceae bacterium]